MENERKLFTLLDTVKLILSTMLYVMHFKPQFVYAVLNSRMLYAIYNHNNLESSSTHLNENMDNKQHSWVSDDRTEALLFSGFCFGIIGQGVFQWHFVPQRC